MLVVIVAQIRWAHILQGNIIFTSVSIAVAAHRCITVHALAVRECALLGRWGQIHADRYILARQPEPYLGHIMTTSTTYERKLFPPEACTRIAEFSIGNMWLQVNMICTGYALDLVSMP